MEEENVSTTPTLSNTTRHHNRNKYRLLLPENPLISALQVPCKRVKADCFWLQSEALSHQSVKDEDNLKRAREAFPQMRGISRSGGREESTVSITEHCYQNNDANPSKRNKFRDSTFPSRRSLCTPQGRTPIAATPTVMMIIGGSTSTPMAANCKKTILTNNLHCAKNCFRAHRLDA